MQAEAGGIPAVSRCHDPYLRCALYGAAQTTLGIKGTCTLAHSPQGCQLLVDEAFRWQDADFTETKRLCTKLCETDIVHGGEDTLRRTILEGRSYSVPAVFVLTSCGPEIVGDDVESICRQESRTGGFDLIPILCAGFRGTQYDGIDLALGAILERTVLPSKAKIPDSVCLIAPHGNANPTWAGDLKWVERTLDSLGIRVVSVLAHDTGFQDLALASQAEAGIVLSHDCGSAAAAYLEEEHGVEWICRDRPLPIGFTNIRGWLGEIGERFGVQKDVNGIIDDGERLVAETLRRKGVEIHFFSRAQAAIAADATVGLPLIRFLAEDLEMVPQAVCLRSESGSVRKMLSRELAGLHLDPAVHLGADVYTVKKCLDEVPVDAVLGSNLERHIADESGVPFSFQVVTPVTRFRLTDREYFGYGGMLNLIEEMQNDWWDRWKSKARRYKARW